VNAFRIPPRFSISLDMSSCVLVLVPVNSKCSMKCAIPFMSSDSDEAPNGFDIDKETIGRSLFSNNIVIPFFSVLFWKSIIFV